MAIQIDMNPDGTFRAPPRASARGGTPASTKILRLALLVAAVAAAGAFAFLALWAAMIMIPIAVGAGLIAYGMIRFRIWKSRGSFRGPVTPYR